MRSLPRKAFRYVTRRINPKFKRDTPPRLCFTYLSHTTTIGLPLVPSPLPILFLYIYIYMYSLLVSSNYIYIYPRSRTNAIARGEQSSRRLLIPFRIHETLLPGVQSRNNAARNLLRHVSPPYLVTPYRMRRLPPCFRVIVDHDRYRAVNYHTVACQDRDRGSDTGIEYEFTLTNLLPQVRSHRGDLILTIKHVK